MEEIMINELTHEGMRRVKVVRDAPALTPALSRWERGMPALARDRMQMTDGRDAALGIFWLELIWPVFEPYEIFMHGPKKFRSLMMVNFAYAERVSECIELARVEFFARTHFAPQYAFVRELPKGAEDGMEVHGCILLAAEWMPGRCAAVGGRG